MAHIAASCRHSENFEHILHWPAAKNLPKFDVLEFCRRREGFAPKQSFRERPRCIFQFFIKALFFGPVQFPVSALCAFWGAIPLALHHAWRLVPEAVKPARTRNKVWFLS